MRYCRLEWAIPWWQAHWSYRPVVDITVITSLVSPRRLHSSLELSALSFGKTIKKIKARTHKSAKTHVTRDFDFWLFDPKINGFPWLTVENFCIMLGIPIGLSYRITKLRLHRFLRHNAKKEIHYTEINGSKNLTPAPGNNTSLDW